MEVLNSESVLLSIRTDPSELMQNAYAIFFWIKKAVNVS